MRAWQIIGAFAAGLLLGVFSTVDFTEDAYAAQCPDRCINPNLQCASSICCDDFCILEDTVRRHTLSQFGPAPQCNGWCWTSQSCVPECNPTAESNCVF